MVCLLFKGGRRIGVEFKRADAPGDDPIDASGQADLGIDRLYVVHPGERRYPLAEGVEAVPLPALLA